MDSKLLVGFGTRGTYSVQGLDVRAVERVYVSARATTVKRGVSGRCLSTDIRKDTIPDHEALDIDVVPSLLVRRI